MNARVLIVDDEPDIRATVEILLGRAGMESMAAESVRSALALLNNQDFDVVLTDMRLGDGSGMDVVRWVADNRPATPVAVITAYGSARDAVTALKAGAFDYVEKPVDTTVLKRVVQDALQLPRKPAETPTPGDATTSTAATKLVGNSPAMQQVRDTLTKLARTQAPVYIHGESGVGKELVAREIHRQGARKNGPFVAVNCGAIPAELFESELFGHVKGSFSGAHADREGLFSAADGGTLFLDEVVDLPLTMQVKLLRVLQERTIRPVGSNHEIPVDVRILSAAQAPLHDAVAAGKMREDLYYRLNVLDLPIPPLRERSEDLEELCQALLARIGERHASPPSVVTADALEKLRMHRFPGNIRELENMLERAVALQTTPGVVHGDQIPRHTAAITTGTSSGHAAPATASSKTDRSESETERAHRSDGQPVDIDTELARSEEQRILEALNATRWNRTKAAEKLGISFRSLRYRLKKLGIDEK